MDPTPEPHVAALVRAIQLAVTPVFLIVGINALLAVLTGRLARIVDRARQLQRQLEAGEAAHPEVRRAELATLPRRMRTVNLGIGLCTSAALLVCLVIIALFTSVITDLDFSRGIAAAFVVTVLLLIGGLAAFLREILLSGQSLRIGMLAHITGEHPVATAGEADPDGTRWRRR